MNLIPAKASQINDTTIQILMLGITANFHAENTVKLENEDVIIGVRPESLPISQNGSVNAVAYSTLPAGMETTVKMAINDNILSSVVFGAIDYAVDEPIKFDFAGNGICLFDKNSEERIAIGSIDVL